MSHVSRRTIGIPRQHLPLRRLNAAQSFPVALQLRRHAIQAIPVVLDAFGDGRELVPHLFKRRPARAVFERGAGHVVTRIPRELS